MANNGIISLRASIDPYPKFRPNRICVLPGHLLGSAFPRPCSGCTAKNSFQRNKTVQKYQEAIDTSRKHYNTPKRDREIKVRVTQEEFDRLELMCSGLKISKSEYIRKAIFEGVIHSVIVMKGKDDEVLSLISDLMTECRRIGNNLNQLARHFNSGGPEGSEIRTDLKNTLTDLTEFRLNAEKVICEQYGDHKAYQF